MLCEDLSPFELDVLHVPKKRSVKPAGDGHEVEDHGLGEIHKFAHQRNDILGVENKTSSLLLRGVCHQVEDTAIVSQQLLKLDASEMKKGLFVS